MDTSQKEIAQLKATVSRLEKIVQQLLNRQQAHDVEIRRAKGNINRLQSQLTAVEYKINRG